MQISMEERQTSLLKFRFGLKWFISRTRNQSTVYEAAVPTVMSAHQTKSSIKADSYLQNTNTFSTRHVHFIVCTHNTPGLGYTDNPATNTLHLLTERKL